MTLPRGSPTEWSAAADRPWVVPRSHWDQRGFLMLHYTVFRTSWGWFGLAGPEGAVSRTCLPVEQRDAAERALLLGLNSSAGEIRLDPDFLPDLQRRIVAYFKGEPADFRTDPPLALDRLTPFGRQVLNACRNIPPGRTRTYSDLASETGRPSAARAVGGVMAANPVPLIVPCHRVLRTDGALGGFSAPGGTATKQRLLRHEQTVPVRS